MPMPRPLADVLADLRAIRPPEEAVDWDLVPPLLAELGEHGDPPEGLAELLGLFERFPGDDAYGVFHTVAHKIERDYLDGLGAALIRSLRSSPSLHGLGLLNRLARSRPGPIDGHDPAALLEAIARRDDLPAVVVETAAEYLAGHRGS